MYYAATGRLTAVPLKGHAALEVGAATPLFEASLVNGSAVPTDFRQPYDVTRDGQRLLLTVPLEEAAPSPITVVVNWMATLKK